MIVFNTQLSRLYADSPLNHPPLGIEGEIEGDKSMYAHFSRSFAQVVSFRDKFDKRDKKFRDYVTRLTVTRSTRSQL